MSKLAIKGGKKLCNTNFFLWPHYDDKEIKIVESCTEIMETDCSLQIITQRELNGDLREAESSEW